jgi:hypothetical protein
MYPKEVVPHAAWSAAAATGEYAYFFGIIDHKHHPDRAFEPVILRFDTSSYAMEEPAVAVPPVRISIYKGSAMRDGNRLIFPVFNKRDSDPELCIAFDLDTVAWGKPFTHPHPPLPVDDD